MDLQNKEKKQKAQIIQHLQRRYQKHEHKFCLYSLFLSPETIGILINLPFVGNTKQLILRSNNIGNNGLKILMKADWTNLQVLELIQNNISKDGIVCLKYQKFNKLRVLDLQTNNVGDEGVKILSKLLLPNIECLNLTLCKLVTQCCGHLSYFCVPSLRYLKQQQNMHSIIALYSLLNMSNQEYNCIEIGVLSMSLNMFLVRDTNFQNILNTKNRFICQ